MGGKRRNREGREPGAQERRKAAILRRLGLGPRPAAKPGPPDVHAPADATPEPIPEARELAAPPASGPPPGPPPAPPDPPPDDGDDGGEPDGDAPRPEAFDVIVEPQSLPAKRGQQKQLFDELQKGQFLSLLKGGSGIGLACETLGVSWRCYDNTRKADREFDFEVRKAQLLPVEVAELELYKLAVGQGKDAPPDLDAIRTFLGHRLKVIQLNEGALLARQQLALEKQKFELAKGGSHDAGRYDISTFSPEQLDAYERFLKSLGVPHAPGGIPGAGAGDVQPVA